MNRRRIDAPRALAVFVAAMALAPHLVRAQEGAGPYTLGRGLPLGSTGVRLGGYLALDWEKPSDEDPSFTFDDLSLFVFGDLGTRVRFFVEIEDSKFWQIKSGRSRVDHHGDLERLYLDYLHGDALKVRAGKFITPIGTWNEIHPDPLTWTVSRPLASYATFPTFLTGIQVFGTLAGDAHDVDYNVFAQANECLDCDTNDRQTERAIGGRMRWRWDAIEVGIPALHYVDRLTADEVTLTGADLLAHKGPVEVRGEATLGGAHRPSHGETNLEYAYYLQGFYALTDRHFLVARQERARGRDREVWTAWSVGGVYRPKPAVSLKLEFQARTGRFPAEEAGSGRRVLTSFGVLF